jgi:peptide-methionine (S)-S-oxide reductase
MKRALKYLAVLLFLYSCAYSQSDYDESFARLPAPRKGEQVATFAGGCFWSMAEGMLELKGVHKVVSGYCGGATKRPTYEEVGSGKTGHAESVQVYYDPAVIDYATLAEAFFYAHDPTTLNRQGPDIGTDYRSVAFYRTPEEQKILTQVIAKVNASHHYHNPVVTEVVPFKVFYPAENYHQGYCRQHPESPYIQSVSMPKVRKLEKAMGDKIKPAFQVKG